ncbi:juvenile hormone esterase [Megalopta genalis]|uniref:juvenile hormone esterase n=1 Tax=Megalopta genalis TaxID=115081 RepID=UPI003FD45413
MIRVAGITFLALWLLPQCLSEEYTRTDVVQTTSGPVRGIVKETVWHSIKYNAFLGIPYAEPPIGNLRFKPPVPKKPWTDVYDAVEEGGTCPQLDFFNEGYIGVEDCLYLNVLTPQLVNGSNPKPVMFWIYGGAFFSGYSNISFYGPDFMLEQDVVFVSMNYRVGALGFLAMRHPNAQGNAGMKDQLLVLKWVRDNIAAFGGDPNEVTMFGESAGGGSVGLHVLSEKSKGLFKRVIQQSGTPLCQWAFHSPDKAFENGRNLASRLGYEGSTAEGIVNFLRGVDAEEMTMKTFLVDFGFLPFRPTVENADLAPDGSSFLTQCPIQKYKSGNFSKVPLLLGHNKNEALFFLDYMVGSGNHQEAIANLVQTSMGISGIVDDMLGAFTGVVFNMLPDPLIQLVLNIFTSLMFTAPIDLTQQLIAKSNENNPIYYYMLSYESQWNVHNLVGDTLNGTSHVDDIAYLFNMQKIKAPTDLNHPFNVFRKKMVTLWTNFAKYGNPTPKNESDPVTFDVIWVDSTATGAQLEINEAAFMRKRTANTITQSYANGLSNRLPELTGCKPIPDAASSSLFDKLF